MEYVPHRFLRRVAGNNSVVQMIGSRRVKGMVSLEGVTYRIERLGASHYAVVRLTDDRRVGAFRTAPSAGVEPEVVDGALLERIARAAIQIGRTSYVFNATPAAPPVAPKEGKSGDDEGPLTPRRGLAPA